MSKTLGHKKTQITLLKWYRHLSFLSLHIRLYFRVKSIFQERRLHPRAANALRTLIAASAVSLNGG